MQQKKKSKTGSHMLWTFSNLGSTCGHAWLPGTRQ